MTISVTYCGSIQYLGPVAVTSVGSYRTQGRIIPLYSFTCKIRGCTTSMATVAFDPQHFYTRYGQWSFWLLHFSTFCSFGFQSHSGMVVRECFKDNNASMEKWEIQPPLPQKPLNLNLHGWLRCGPLPLGKISSRHDYCLLPPPPNMWKCASSDSASFFILLSVYSQDPWTNFYAQKVKWRLFVQGCAFWGSRKQIFIFWPHFPQNRNFGLIFDGKQWHLWDVLRSNIIFCDICCFRSAS